MPAAVAGEDNVVAAAVGHAAADEGDDSCRGP